MFKFFEKQEPIINPVEDRQLARGESLEAVGPEPKDYDLPKERYRQEMDNEVDDFYKQAERKEEEQQPLHPYEDIEKEFDREIEAERKDMPLTANGPVKNKDDESHSFKPVRPKGGETSAER